MTCEEGLNTEGLYEGPLRSINCSSICDVAPLKTAPNGGGGILGIMAPANKFWDVPGKKSKRGGHVNDSGVSTLFGSAYACGQARCDSCCMMVSKLRYKPDVLL